MITLESMMSIDKGDLEEASKNPGKEDVPQLVEWLDEKDDKVRYQAFLLLKNRSSFLDDVYPYWDVFRSKLKSPHSYQRSIGLMLLAENAKWDDAGRMEDTIDDFLALLNDEKPITARQCIQSLERIARAKPGLNEKTARRLLSFDLSAVKETMRKVIIAGSSERFAGHQEDAGFGRNHRFYPGCAVRRGAGQKIEETDRSAVVRKRG